MTDTSEDSWDELCRLTGTLTDDETRVTFLKEWLEEWFRNAVL